MFMDVASQIDPATVHIKSLTDPQSLQVLEQNYEFDLLSPEKLMEKYVGKTVKIKEKNYYTGKEEIYEAKLLSVNNGPIFKVNDEIYSGLSGQIIYPEIPGNLIAEPTLIWLLQNDLDKTQKVEASYLTGGIGWKADYVTVLNKDDNQADLSGWVTIDNKSGATYQNASVQLVAGDVNRVEAPNARFKAEMDMAGAAARVFVDLFHQLRNAAHAIAHHLGRVPACSCAAARSCSPGIATRCAAGEDVARGTGACRRAAVLPCRGRHDARH